MTVNEHVAVLPDASVAVPVTVVVPTGNVDPEAGLYEVVTPGQLSEAVGGGYVTTAEFIPGSVSTRMFAGQVIVGGCVSLTVMVKLHVAVLPVASVAVQFTVVVPFGKNDPDAGEQITLVPGQLSLNVGAG